MEIWKKKIKNPIQPPNGELSIFKLSFPNGSYRNKVCRALWAVSPCGIPLKYSFVASPCGIPMWLSLKLFFNFFILNWNPMLDFTLFGIFTTETKLDNCHPDMIIAKHYSQEMIKVRFFLSNLLRKWGFCRQVYDLWFSNLSVHFHVKSPEVDFDQILKTIHKTYIGFTSIIQGYQKDVLWNPSK